MTGQPNSTVQDPPVYNVRAFCEAHDISRGYLYKLWRDGQGPRRMKVGRRTYVSGAAAAEWRFRMEAQSSAAATQTPATRGDS